MKKVIIYSIFALGLLGCMKEKDAGSRLPAEGHRVSITACVDPDTKTAYEGGKVFSWEEGDIIGVVVLAANGEYQQVPFVSSGSGSSAEFTGILEEGASIAGYASYPFRGADEDGFINDLLLSSTDSPDDFILSSVLRSKERDQMSDIPLVGTRPDETEPFVFRTAVGILQVNFSGLSGDIFDRITLEGKEIPQGGEAVSLEGMFSSDDEIPGIVSRQLDGVDLDDSFLFFLPPGVIQEGMKVSLIDKNDREIYSVTTRSTIEITRNKVISLTSVGVPEEVLLNGTALNPVSFTDTGAQTGQVVRKGDDGGIVVCFTREADLSSIMFCYETDGIRVLINDAPVESGCVLDLTEDVTVTVEARDGDTKAYTITALPSDLPVLAIDTPDGQPIVSKETWIENSKIALWTTDGVVTDLTTTKIKGRGNSTWYFPPKKSYNIKLDKKASILGIPKDKNWCLLANFLERTKLRNYVGFALAAKTRLSWTPKGHFVELVLNGRHTGMYYLCEKIKIGSNRIDITEMKSTDIDESTVTGGYLLEFDTMFDEVNKFMSKVLNLPVMIKEPDEDVLVSEQLDYIRSYIDTIDARLTSGRPYEDLIDADSFIDVWMVKELTLNTEMSLPRSTYFYKDRGGLLKAGPVWDFDLDKFRSRSAFVHKDKSIWYKYLFTYPEFVARAKEKWNENKAGFQEVIDSIDSMHEAIRFSEARDATMWVLDTSYPYTSDADMTFDDANAAMITNLNARWSWLDNAINNL